LRDKLVIIGSGGHAKVVIDILRNADGFSLIGCTDPSNDRMTVMGLPVLGDDSVLERLHKEGVKHAFVALGDNRLRQERADHALSLGFELVNAVSGWSCIAPSVKLGRDIAVMPGAVVNADSVVGDNVIINTGVTVDHDCVLGSGVHLAPGCNLAGNVTVGRNAFLGTGCKVIPKISIGEGSTIGAGSVVIRDIPDNSVAYGVPAKVVRKN
jgi:UDP-perosamine 4-acetyltransferase